MPFLIISDFKTTDILVVIFSDFSEGDARFFLRRYIHLSITSFWYPFFYSGQNKNRRIDRFEQLNQLFQSNQANNSFITPKNLYNRINVHLTAQLSEIRFRVFNSRINKSTRKPLGLKATLLQEPLATTIHHWS